MLARRRSYLFLGGACSSAISLLLVLRLGTWLFGSGQALAFQVELYLGLLVFVGYVLFDTQVSVSRLSCKQTLSAHHHFLREAARGKGSCERALQPLDLSL